VTFLPGETSQTVSVATLTDGIYDPNETFSLVLSTPTNASIADDTGLGTILDVSGKPTVSIADAPAVNEGTSTSFAVTLSKPSTETITVQYGTQNGSALAPGDYTATTGTVTFLPGETSMTVSVPTLADAVYDPNETFSLVLSTPTNASIADTVGLGTIVDDSIVDLSIAEMASTLTPNGGDVVTFTITITNAAGLDEATGVRVAHALGTGLQFVSSTQGGGSYDGATGLWTVGSVAAGETVTLEVRMLVLETGTYTSSVQVAATDQPDVDSIPANASIRHEDDDDSLTLVPIQADLAVEKTVSNATPDEGDLVDFVVTITNLGPNDTAGVVITDALPNGLQYMTDTGGGTYSPITGQWTVGALAVGEQATLRLTTRVELRTLGRTMENVAEITTHDISDFNPSNDRATASVTIGTADLAVAKAVDNATPAVGDTVTFTITLRNLGPDAPFSIHVAELLPPGLAFVSHSGDGVYDSALGKWSVETLAVGQAVSLEIIAQVGSGTEGSTLTNTVKITQSGVEDPDLSNNRDTADVEVTSGGGGGAGDGCFGRMIINEVAWAGTAANPESQWVELRNVGTAPIDLTGWTLRWRKKVPVTVEDHLWKEIQLSGVLKGAGTSACELAELEPTADVEFIKRDTDSVSWLVVAKPAEDDGSYLLLERKTDDTIRNIEADIVYDIEQPYSLDLSPDGDVMELRDHAGNTVDTANAFEPIVNAWPAGDASMYATMERTDPLAPDTADNWHTNIGIVTKGEDATGRPLVATARTLNSEPLDEWTLYAQELKPTQAEPGAQFEVGLPLAQASREDTGWPWIRVSQPGDSDIAGGGAAATATPMYVFAGRQTQGEYWVNIDTESIVPGDYLIWIVFGEGEAVLVPITILP
jgi:uncharacterized repeat protein (TIGR01451 family)